MLSGSNATVHEGQLLPRIVESCNAQHRKFQFTWKCWPAARKGRQVLAVPFRVAEQEAEQLAGEFYDSA